MHIKSTVFEFICGFLMKNGVWFIFYVHAYKIGGFCIHIRIPRKKLGIEY
jgi:hypothetical protein